MYIRKLELFRYKRFFLSNTELLVIEPSSNIQIILGQNGIGKSSLLGMLNPLPGDIKREFNEGGYKYIEIEQDGVIFKLLSGGELGNKHSFKVNDIELNNGGTISVQLELVKEYFKITPYINSIILGTNRFTLMSYAERKNIFQDISNIDYTYSLNVYNKLKSRHRDIVGGIKILQDSIIKTKANIVEDVEVEKMKYDLTMLKEYIDHIVSLYNHNVYGKDNYLDIKNKIIEVTRDLKRYNKLSLDNINKEELVNENLILENTIKNNKNKIEIIKEKINSCNNLNLGNVDDIQKEINVLNNKIDTTLMDAKYLNINSLEQINSIHEVYGNVIEEFIAHLLELDNYYGILSKTEDVTKFKNELDELENRYNIRNKMLENAVSEYTHIQEHKRSDNLVKCNNCGEEWFHKVDLVKEKELKEFIDNNSNKVNEMLIELKNKKEDYNTILEKLNIISNIKKFIQFNIILKPVFFYILSKVDIHTTKSNLILTELTKINIDLGNWYNVYLESKKLSALENDLKLVQNTNIIIKDANDKNLEHLESELSKLINENYINEVKINKNNKQLVNIENIITMFYRLKKLLKDYKHSYKDSVEILRNEHLKKLTTELKNQMLELEQKINLNNQYLVKYNSDNNSLSDLISREKILKIMIKELSPTEGLIAKSINSFLNMFIKDVNVIINKIWQYDLELLPCTINDENDLDYKFSVKVDRTEEIEDVKKLSSSMQEVVDLAFRLVYIKYRKLVDTPLMLDEFARTFDVVHQVKAYDVIDTLFTNNFKQIFIVSHFESMYGRFVNSEITILGSDENYKK